MGCTLYISEGKLGLWAVDVATSSIEKSILKKRQKVRIDLYFIEARTQNRRFLKKSCFAFF